MIRLSPKTKPNLILRWIASMAIILAFSSILFSFLVYHFFSGNYREEINQYNRTMLEQAKNLIDIQLIESTEQEIQSSIVQLMQDDAFDRILSDPAPNNKDLLKLHDTVMRIKSDNPLAFNIAFFVTASNTIISSQGIKFLDDPKNRTIVDTEWISAARNNSLSRQWLPPRPIYTELESPNFTQQVVSFIQNYPVTTTEEHIAGIFSVSIAVETVNNLLKTIIPEGFGNILVKDGDGEIIFSVDPTAIRTEDDRYAAFHSQIEAAKKGFFIQEEARKQTAVNFTSSERNQWRYIVLTPYDTVYRSTVYLRKLMMLMCGVVIIAGTALMVIDSRLFFSSLTQLVKSAENLAMRIQSGEKEMMPLRNARQINDVMNRVAENVDSMETFMRNNRAILRSALLNDLISGAGLQDDLTEQLASFQIATPFPGYCIAILENLSAKHAECSGRRHAAMEYVMAGLETGLSRATCLVYGFQIDNGRIGLMINCDEKTFPVLPERIVMICESPEIQGQWITGIGLQVKTPAQLYLSGKTAETALNRHFFHPEERVFLPAESDTGADSHGEFDFRQVENLCEMIKTGTAENVCDAISGLINSMRNEPLNRTGRQQTIIFIASSLKKVLYDLDYSENEVFEEEIIHAFHTIRDISALQNRLKTDCLKMHAFINTRQDNRHQRIVKQIVKYLKKNKKKELSLTQAAEAVGISTSYLSKVFKEEMGIKFVDYCKTVKLEYARDLLITSNKNIETIAAEAGYSQTQYFITQFKQRYQLTPKQYHIRHFDREKACD